jgi:GTPase SAR1 family protein
MDSYPKFAVVGHPNKGKSSIVSTLSQDETVTISSIPGTTTKQRAFPLKVDNQTLYELYDTPGFQRSRTLLHWLKREPTTANKKADRLKEFLYEHRDNPKFTDEVELLTPIVNGAGIIYVADASKPYGPEYEAEMEILRWSGQPSMALINLIGDENYQDEWQKALEHYFKIVRVFNPMKANFSQILELLEAMAELKYEWRGNLKKVIETLKLHRMEKISNSSFEITSTVIKILTYEKNVDIEKGFNEKIREELESEYKMEIKRFEDKAYSEIATIWYHPTLKNEISDSKVMAVELFSKESVQIFGLDKRDLVKNAVIAGAVTGSGFDLAVGGHSLFLGSLIGAAIGGGSVMFGFKRLKNSKFQRVFREKKFLKIGPIEDSNFAFVLLRRLLYFTKEIANRPHANRDRLSFDDEVLFSREWIAPDIQKKLLLLHLNIASQKRLKENRREYQEIVKGVLTKYCI